VRECAWVYRRYVYCPSTKKVYDTCKNPRGSEIALHYLKLTLIDSSTAGWLVIGLLLFTSDFAASAKGVVGVCERGVIYLAIQ